MTIYGIEGFYVPRNLISDKLMGVHYVFETYLDLLASDKYTTEDYGRIVMVNDMTDFPSKKPMEGWAVVRLIGDPKNADGWQVIAEEEIEELDETKSEHTSYSIREFELDDQ